MSNWNPSLYLHFAAERSRPAVELLARVSLENIEYIADLGCGPGNSTALLHQRWPAARITGIDSSPAMIAEARSALPDCLFVEADIRNWQPEQALDLIFANASLQWLPDHYELFPHLVSLLSPLGVLAVQMPVRREVVYGTSKFDLYFETDEQEKGFLEIKGMTLENKQIGA